LGDYNEKQWGQQLAKNERKRKRDGEVQEIFAAFRMVAVELINRVQNYKGSVRMTSIKNVELEKFLEDVDVEMKALINMINDALRNISVSYCYSVPYISTDNKYYCIRTKNFSMNKTANITVKPVKVYEEDEEDSGNDGKEKEKGEIDESTQLQMAIEASLKY